MLDFHSKIIRLASLGLFPKIIASNQIAGLLKFLYLKNGMRYEIDFLHNSNKSIGLGLT